jgi:hypothetical protein
MIGKSPSYSIHVQKMLAPTPAKKNPIGYIHPKD